MISGPHICKSLSWHVIMVLEYLSLVDAKPHKQKETNLHKDIPLTYFQHIPVFCSTQFPQKLTSRSSGLQFLVVRGTPLLSHSVLRQQ